MEKASNNIKFFTFVNILRAYSNEDVSISIKEINNHMKKKLGVTLDRRTIYSYIKDMREMGMNVSNYNKEKEGYFLIDDFFEDGELKLLMDSVKSSNFISKKKTEELLKKIGNMSYMYKGEKVESNVLIDDSEKIANEETYSNMNMINEAINHNQKITFYYLDEKINSDNQIILTTNPICMINDHTNYYLISILDNLDEITIYRVDKISNMKILEEKARSLTNLKISHKLNISKHIKENLGDYVKKYTENGGDHGTGY